MKFPLKSCAALVAAVGFALLPAAAERAGDGLLGRADGLLREEVRGLYGDLTSAGRWREFAVGSANGEQADIRGWLSSRWEETPGRLADRFAAGVAETAAAGLREGGWVEHLDFSFGLPLRGREGRLELNATGSLWTGTSGGDTALGWHLPLAIGGEDDGGADSAEVVGNLGIFYRRTLGDGLAGLNVFGDYQDAGSDGGFWRWSAGLEYRSAWADVFANRYFPVTGAKRRLLSGGRERLAYTAGGYDAEVRFHSPRSRWLEGFAAYELWEGEFGDGDDAGFRYGFRMSPETGGVVDGLRLEADYDDGGDGLGARFSYEWLLGGRSGSGGYGAFDAGAYLYAPVERRHGQRIRQRIRILEIGKNVIRTQHGGMDRHCDLEGRHEGVLDKKRRKIYNEDLNQYAKEGNFRGVCNAIFSGADIDGEDGDDWAIHHAAAAPQEAAAIVNLLITVGANYDANGKRKRRAAHYAASANAVDVLSVLVSAGANINTKIKNKKREHPLDVAIKVTAWEAAGFLRGAGGVCRNQPDASDSESWCNNQPVSVIFAAGVTATAAGDYRGAIGEMRIASAPVSPSIRYSLREPGVFSIDSDSGEIFVNGALEGGIYSAVAVASVTMAGFEWNEATASIFVTVIKQPDLREIIASPYAEGALMTLDLPNVPDLTLVFESDIDAPLTMNRDGEIIATAAMTLRGEYRGSVRVTAENMLGALDFLVKMEADCKPGLTRGADAGPLSSGFFDAVESGNANDVCAYVGGDETLVGKPDIYGDTPVHWAVLEGENEILALLLDLGADINAQNDDYRTPLDLAVDSGARRMDSVRLLTARGGVCLNRFLLENTGHNESRKENCGLRMWPLQVVLTVAANHSGEIYAIPATIAGGTVEYGMPKDGKFEVNKDTGTVSIATPAQSADSRDLAVLVVADAQTLTADIRVTVLAEFPAEMVEIYADWRDSFYTFSLPEFGGAMITPSPDNPSGFSVSEDGDVSLSGARGGKYQIVATATHSNFVGAAMLTLDVVVVNPTPLIIRRVAVDGYNGVVGSVSVEEGSRASYGQFPASSPFALVSLADAVAVSVKAGMPLQGGVEYPLAATITLSSPNANLTRVDVGGTIRVLTARAVSLSSPSPYESGALLTIGFSAEEFSADERANLSFSKVSGDSRLAVGRDGGVTVLAASLTREESYTLVAMAESAGPDMILGPAPLFTVVVTPSCRKQIDGIPPNQRELIGELPSRRNSVSYTAETDGDLCDLLRKGADPNHSDLIADVLGWAAYYSDEGSEAVQMLLDAGANVEGSGWVWFRPLHMATFGGHASIAETLLDAGADKEGRSIGGLRPIHGAAWNENTVASREMVNLLIRRGANINARSDSGGTALHTAAGAGRSSNLIFLVTMVSHVSPRDNNEVTPLHLAAQSAGAESVEVLLNAGADAIARTTANDNSKNETPLHYAARGGNVTVVSMLLSRPEVTPNPKNSEGETPLHLAAENRNYLRDEGVYFEQTAHVSLFIAHDANVNNQDDEGNTPLHRAVKVGNAKAVSVLIKNGANVNATNNAGENPLDIAVKKNLAQIILTLDEEGAVCNKHSVSTCGAR